MKVTIELTVPEMHAILQTAGNGCAYWAATEEYLHTALEQPVPVHDRETGELLGTLTREACEAAAGRMAALCKAGKLAKRIMADLLEDPECCDADAADAFVQVALFNELVYG